MGKETQNIRKQKPRFGRFTQARGFMDPAIKAAVHKRGFSDSRILTNWPEIVGAECAKICRPVKLSHSGKGMGATLLLLARPGFGPEIEMQKEAIRKRVNAVFGYNAVSRITLTQTAPTGFSERGAVFERKPKAAPKALPALSGALKKELESVSDQGLKEALESLGASILGKTHQRETR